MDAAAAVCQSCAEGLCAHAVIKEYFETNTEIKVIVKKTAKAAGVTCIAAGAVALMTSAAAIKAMTEGAKYLKDAVRRIIGETDAIANSDSV